MNEEHIYDLLAKHFSGETTSEEEKIITLWLQEDPLNEELYHESKNLWVNVSPNNHDWDNETAWNILLEKTNLGQKRTYTISNITRTVYRRIHFAKTVALFLIIIFGSYLIFLSDLFNRSENNTAEWIEKVTAPGEKAEIILSDNSKIILNGSSKLKYPERFKSIVREVELEGEGYFDVFHKTNSPFIVHTGNLSTTVLGTKFNVSAFKNENNIAVSLIEGKVRVSKKESNQEQPIIILKPDQQFIYSRKTDVSMVEEFDLDKTIGWRDNILKFDNEPLDQVLTRIERAYGTEFEIAANSFKNFKVTANFRNESCLTVTEVLQKLTGLEAKTIKENNEIKRIVFEER